MKAWPVSNLDPDGEVLANARKIIRVRMGELYSFEPAVSDPTNRRALHDMRIASKRLRYSLEMFLPVLDELGELNAKRAKRIQRVLGKLHDVDVRIDRIEKELTHIAVEQIAQLGDQLRNSPVDRHASVLTRALRPPPDDPRRGLIALLGRQHVLGQQHYLEFKELWEQFESEGMREDLAELSRGTPGI